MSKGQTFTMISVGRLVWEKGYSRLIRAHKLLLDEGYYHRLIILGDGYEKEELNLLIKNLKVSDTCHIIGPVENPYSWINASDVFVSSSITEGLPLVIMESMVLNKPIIATKVSGAIDLLNEDIAMLVENNLDSIYEGLKTAIKNKDLLYKYSYNLSKYDKKIFDKLDIMNQIETLFGDYNKQKKNILFVMSNIALGGAEKTLSITLDNIDYNKYNVDLLLLSKEKSNIIKINENVNVMYAYENSDEVNKNYYNKTLKINMTDKYDVQIGYLGIITADIALNYGNKNAIKIGWVHGNFENSVVSFDKQEVKDVYDRLDYIVCVSQSVENSYYEYMESGFDKRIKLISNIIDVDNIRKLSLDPIDSKYKYILGDDYENLIKPNIYVEEKKEEKPKNLELIEWISKDLNINTSEKIEVLIIICKLESKGFVDKLEEKLQYVDRNKFNIKLTILVNSEFKMNTPFELQYIYENDNQLWMSIMHSNFILNLDREYALIIGYESIICNDLVNRLDNKYKKVIFINESFRASYTGYTIDYLQQMFSNVDKIITDTESTKLEFFNYIQSIEYDKICPYTKNFKSEDIEYRSGYDKVSVPKVISVGRLEDGKGFKRLISIHKKLIDKGIKHILNILGDGPQREEYQQIIQRYKIEETCKIVGYKNNPYIWINQSDIFILASYNEGLPLSIMEALILKKPVVATNVNGCRDLLKNGYGMLVDNDEDSLCRGLESMIMDKELRQSYIDNIENVSSFEFDEKLIIPKIESFIDSISEKVNKKVLFVMYSLETAGCDNAFGGAEKALFNTLNKLDKDKYEIDLIILAKGNSDLSIIDKNINIRYIYHSYSEVVNNYRDLIFNTGKDYDVEFAYGDNTTAQFIINNGYETSLKVAWIHSTWLGIETSTEELRSIYEKMDKFIFVSESVRDSFINRFGDGFNNKLEIIYNPMPVDYIVNMSENLSE